MIGDLMGAYSFHRLRAVPLPRGGRSGGFAGQGLRPCRRLNIGALRSPLSPFARPLETLLFEPFKLTGAANIKNGRAMRAPTVSKPLIQPRVQGRNPARFKGGYGVPRGFKGGSKPSAPCGRLSEAEHPKRKGATLLRPLSAVNRNLRETRIVAQALLAISDFRHAFSRTAGAWLQSP